MRTNEFANRLILGAAPLGRERASRKHSLRELATLASALLLMSLDLYGQALPDLPFNSGSTGADGPMIFPPSVPRRWIHATAYDAERKQIVLFGGGVFPGQIFLNDTWVWDDRGWTRMNPTNPPSVRRYHAMAYDAARKVVVMFGGGVTGDVVVEPGTWIWDGNEWNKLTPAHSPPPTLAHAMAYDAARQQVVLQGGATGPGYTNQTWIWDGLDWTRTNSLPSASVTTRSMAYDAKHQEIVTYLPNGETWTWNGMNWIQKANGGGPSPSGTAMAFDEARQEIVLFGGEGSDNRTWIWNGTNWAARATYSSPPTRRMHTLTYDGALGKTMLFDGYSDASAKLFNDAWLWDGVRWVELLQYYFDMRGQPSAVWNFTTITVPSDLTVGFKNNSNNTPVRWLATESVTIDGTLDLSGKSGGPSGLGAAPPGMGGPGGYPGGLGGEPFFAGGSYAGTPGQGPGGGMPGTNSTQSGNDATYASSYGNAFIQPLTGGSGGGGSGSAVGTYGNNGGGGGGAILISSSRDIIVNGAIVATGGRGYNGSGAGSGGAIRLRADRIAIKGSLQANDDGRIRLKAYERDLSGSITPTNLLNRVFSGPVPDNPLDTPGSGLLITQVAGQNVTLIPGGDLFNPDVTFSQPGDITVTVQGYNIPAGTPVRLRVTMVGNVINKPAAGEPPALLSGGTATFTLTVPRGRGTLQAFAEFTVP